MKLPNDKIGEMELPLILPHRIMEYLLNECSLVLSDALVESFWNHLDEVADTWATSTKDFRQAAMKKVWPLGLYGDEAVIGLQNNPYLQMMGLFVSVPLFRPRATRVSRYCMFAIESDRLVSYEATLYPVLERIVQSCNMLTERGVDGRRFLVSELRGDQMFFRKLFLYESWWTCRNVCFRCAATTVPGPLSYLVYEAPDGWNSTRRTTAEFVRDELPDNKCSLRKL